jgi:hypothetical protein
LRNTVVESSARAIKAESRLAQVEVSRPVLRVSHRSPSLFAKETTPVPSPANALPLLLQREDIRLHGLGRLQDRLEAADAKVEDLTRELNTLRGKDEVRVRANAPV